MTQIFIPVNTLCVTIIPIVFTKSPRKPQPVFIAFLEWIRRQVRAKTETIQGERAPRARVCVVVRARARATSEQRPENIVAKAQRTIQSRLLPSLMDATSTVDGF
jgi:hypothetical protein